MVNRSASSDPSPLHPYLQRTRRSLIYAGLFSFCISIFMLALPLYSLQVLDRVLSSQSMETLYMLSIIMVVAIMFYGIFFAIRNAVLSSISEWLDQELSPILLKDAVVKSSLGMNVNASQHQRDLTIIRNFATTSAGTLLDAPWSLLFILVIYLINPVLGFLSIIGMIILIGFAVINEFSTRKKFEESSKEQIGSQYMADTASRNAEAIEAMGMMDNVVNVWQEHQHAASKHSLIAQRRANIIQSVSRTLRLTIQIGVTGFGGYLALQNELSVGGMIAGSILVGRALAPFENAIGIWKSWISARESYHRLNKALSAGKAVERGTLELPEPQGLLTVENLIFTPPGSAPILKGITFGLQPGQSMGLVGPSGAGKSTLSKVIMGLVPPTHGAARLDGADTFKWNRANFGRYVGYMPQSVDLFTGTIKDNIARMDRNASTESVIAAAQMAECHEMILRLPNGYETVVTPKMNSLSPGQRQRIGLARAIYGNPKFVLLDEPNNNLDGDGERALIVAIQRMKQAGMTFIVVSHRPSIVGNIDVLLVLKAGTVERFGTTQEIISQYQTGAAGTSNDATNTQ